MTAREQLDQRMRDVLLQLAVCSHVSAPPYEPRGRSGATTSRVLVGGDLGNHYLALAYGAPFHICDGHCRHRWLPAHDDHAREQVLLQAETELASIRRGAGLTDAQRNELKGDVAAMLEDTVGWAPEDVERSRFRISARLVRRHRRAAGLNPETGQLVDDALELAGRDLEELRRRARAYKAEGKQVSQIALLLRLHRNTVRKYVQNDRAAA
jgi:hypothetical protein